MSMHVQNTAVFVTACAFFPRVPFATARSTFSNDCNFTAARVETEPKKACEYVGVMW
jgi:hypothetical protein